MESSNRFSNALGKAAGWIEKVIHPISKYLLWGAMGAIVFDMVLIVIDVISRKALMHPILGAYELGEFSMVLMIVLAFGFTQVLRGHISVELLVDLFPKRVKAVLGVFSELVCLAFWGTIAYQAYIQTGEQRIKGIASANLLIPLWPFVLILAIGCTCFAIVLVADVIRSIQIATSSKAYLDSLNKALELTVSADGEAEIV